MKKYKYHILLVLFIISFIASLILSLTPVPEVCNFEIGCEVVHNSPYNYMFGIKNSYYGTFIFLIGSFLIFSQINHKTKQKRKLINFAVVIGAVIALYFFYIQQFVLHAYCEYCLAVDISMIAALIITILYWKK